MKSEKNTLYEIVREPGFIETAYGLVQPEVKITYNNRNLHEADITFSLSNMRHECSVKSETSGASGISLYSKKIAEGLAHTGKKDKKGILFTPDQVEVLFGPLLEKGYEKIKEKSR